jgi:hypothetical protein
MQTKRAMEINKKLAMIGKFYYDLSKQDENFKLAIAFRNKEGDLIWSKWRTFLDCCNDDRFLMNCNNRTILKNELVLDIDLPKEEATKRMIEITNELKERKIPFEAYFTGSKGYHIHIFNNKWFYIPKNKREQKKYNLIKYFKCDTMKSSDNCMIAMEDCGHWKTGNKKELVIHWTN